ncbi:MAG: cupin domain-containing protein [Candidatus Pacebacteria bacterium]|nr:cupin domain-containing protein [Candidatus Paceibacterota bacterium]
MKGHITNIEKDTLENENFRKVIFTAKNMQLVLMSLEPNEEIGEEMHDDVDQFIRIEKGNGKAILNGEEYEIMDGSSVVIPAGVKHNIINSSAEEKLKLYTIYSPPEHRDGVIHQTKEDAMSDEEDVFEGETSMEEDY